jgi:hypothetical protein
MFAGLHADALLKVFQVSTQSTPGENSEHPGEYSEYPR